MSNTNSETNSEHTTSNDDTVPYTITEQDGKLNVVFTSGPKQGENFQIEKPHHFDTEHPQPQQVEEEPPYPYSYLDGQGIEISKEEFERLSAIDLAEEARL
jgi:hypothetical protein